MVAWRIGESKCAGCMRWMQRRDSNFKAAMYEFRIATDAGNPLRCYRRVSRQPAAWASSTEQNQRVPLLIFMLILAYQRLAGVW